MRYLLDTHILLWWLYDDPKLPTRHRRLLEDTRNEIFVSSASIWEIEIKRQKGNLAIDDRYLDAIEAEGFSILSIRPEHALALRRIPMLHQDPFDRILIAQTIAEGIPLLSVDKKVLQYDIPII
jgi:PIN domain nuclease of toxin-antitoxin system